MVHYSKHILAAIAILAAVGLAAPAQRKALGPDGIQFKATIPLFAKGVQVYKLTKTEAPTEFVNSTLSSLRVPALTLSQSELLSISPASNLLSAHIEPETHDATLLPDLKKLLEIAKTSPGLTREKAMSIAQGIISDKRLIPADSTSVKLAAPIEVSGAEAEASPDRKSSKIIDPPAVRFTMVPVQRTVNELAIVGPGSRLVITLANDGTVHGFVRKWRVASPDVKLETPMNAEQVRSEILRQLEPLKSEFGHITVELVNQAYYDGNKDFLQPVYHFSAHLTTDNGEVADEYCEGFVPAGRTLEPIPDLATDRGIPLPADPTSNPPREPAPEGPGSQEITVGVYINRNHTMLDMADDFLNGLKLPQPGRQRHFVNTQNYEAYPDQVDGPSAQKFLNSVDVAYTEPHGGRWCTTTLGEGKDSWHIQTIAPGFGSATGGRLKTWFIDACCVMPAAYDTENAAQDLIKYQDASGKQVSYTLKHDPAAAFDVWWPVFQGLHTVLGFRTEMLLHDHKNEELARLLRRGADVNMAWFQCIAGDPMYYNSKTHVMKAINQEVHMGRASTFTDARDLGKSIYDLRKQTPSTQLWNFWMSN